MENTEKFYLKNSFLLKIILASILFHIAFLLINLETKKKNYSTLSQDKVQKLLVKLMTKSKATQIVETKNQNKIKSEKAKFLGKADNFIKRQTKNRNVGAFSTAAKGVRSAVKNESRTVKKAQRVKSLKNIKFSDLGFKTQDFQQTVKKKQAKLSSAKKGLKNGKVKGRNLGSSSDFLEDIPLGDFTQLNTQEHQFYGFYHRIRQKLEQFWGNNLQTEADKIFKQGRSIASDTNLITGLTIKLNSKGEIVDIGIKSASGMKELDDAAIKSFNQAGPFPNPPKGMLGADGKATIEWGFVVNT